MIDILTYLNRITSEHKTKPHFMSLVETRLRPFIDLYECLETFDEAFDLDTAVGKQLDVIGEYIGVKRLLSFQPHNMSSLLSDYYYRSLLKAKISLNVWDGTSKGILLIWKEMFPGYSIELLDNQDMSIRIKIKGLQSLFDSEIIQHGLINPKPMGVQVGITISYESKIERETAISAKSIFVHTCGYLNFAVLED